MNESIERGAIFDCEMTRSVSSAEEPEKTVIGLRHELKDCFYRLQFL